MEVKFSDTQKVEEILQVITPLKENIPCLISKSTKLWFFYETFESITCYLFVFKNFVMKLISEL